MNYRIACLTVALTFALKAENPLRAESVATTNQVHATRGIVREIAPDRHKAVIRHEAIPDYMPAMTMEFNVRNTNQLSGISAGDTITFRLTATEDTHWVDQVRRISAATNNPPVVKPRLTPSRIAELKPGDLMPDYELQAEDGRTIRFSDFRGKAVAFTFFFTRCPLPDYCPRMSSHFAQARDLILANTNVPVNWQFLSISFDPDFDTPGVLSSYGGFYRKGNPDRWLFAAAPMKSLAGLAPRLDLMINREPGGSISHNLRTVVLDPLGRIHRQFDGNEWTPGQLAESLMNAAAVRN
ncbi:MAG TPA: copper-binding protein [Candidatus Paceibacterota bacterium]|nr:copper-binding protein [Candidatus Paceibacterota bacterium]